MIDWLRQKEKEEEEDLWVVAVEAACDELEGALLLSGAGRTESRFSGFDDLVLWRRGTVET